MRALREYLKNEYVVVSLDFQRMNTASFAEEKEFSSDFAAYFLEVFKRELTGKSLETNEALEDLKLVAQMGKKNVHSSGCLCS